MTLPLPASYQRVADGIFSGGTYVSWGTDNREVPVRLTNATEPASRNFEMKMLDGTASPYFALSAILGAGLAGIERGVELTTKDCSGLSAAQRGEEGRKALGITQRVPGNWVEARTHLKENEVLANLLGPSVVEKFLSVTAVSYISLDRTQSLFGILQAMAKGLETPEDESARMSLLVENY